MPREFDGRKLESTTKDGSDLGDEDEKNKLDELKVEGRRRGQQEVMNGVKCYLIRPKPTTRVLDRRGVFVARVSTGSAVQQQCSR